MRWGHASDTAIQTGNQDDTFFLFYVKSSCFMCISIRTDNINFK